MCFKVSFISRLYMFRAHVLIISRSKLHYTASGIVTPVGGRHVHRAATYTVCCTQMCQSPVGCSVKLDANGQVRHRTGHQILLACMKDLNRILLLYSNSIYSRRGYIATGTVVLYRTVAVFTVNL